VYYSVVQCVAVRCIVLQCEDMRRRRDCAKKTQCRFVHTGCDVCVAVSYSVL